MVLFRNPKKPLDLFLFYFPDFFVKTVPTQDVAPLSPSGSFCGYCVGSNKEAAKFGGQPICLTRINEG